MQPRDQTLSSSSLSYNPQTPDSLGPTDPSTNRKPLLDLRSCLVSQTPRVPGPSLDPRILLLGSQTPISTSDSAFTPQSSPWFILRLLLHFETPLLGRLSSNSDASLDPSTSQTPLSITPFLDNQHRTVTYQHRTVPNLSMC